MTESGSELRRAGNGKVIEPSPRAGGRRAGRQCLKRLAARLLFAGSLLLPAMAHAQTTTVAGVTDGSLAVDASGSATYSIPIKVPSGTAGMHPSLALSYSSRGGEGALGIGWSFGGFSTVHRCAQTRAQDDVVGGLNYDADDRFCLDGTRLVAISGLYGADGTEYRTEVESFTKVVSYGAAGSGPASFKAWTKSGQVIEFGVTEDSRAEAGGKAEARFWATNKVSDSAGNYLTVSYNEDPLAGSFLIDRIDYSGNSAASLAPFASVRLTYEARPDSIVHYASGSRITRDQRLLSIGTFVGETKVRDYRLGYDNNGAGGRTRLVSVTECDGAENCLAPIQFAWTQSSFAPFPQPITPIGNSEMNGGNGVLLTGDWNGDGIYDALWYRSNDGVTKWFIGDGSAGFSATHNAIPPGAVNDGGALFPGDWNGDGFTDFLWWNRDNGRNRWFINDGNLGFVQINNVIPTGSINNGGSIIVGDWNGDSLTDVLWYNNQDGRNRWFTITHSGGALGYIYNSNPIPTASINSGGQLSIGDWNGDGLADAVWLKQPEGKNRWYTNTSKGGPLAFSQLLDPINSTLVNDGGYFTLGDWNGDGTGDLLYFNPSSGQNRWFVNDGALGFTLFNNPIEADKLDGANNEFHVGDWNGDGISDAVWRKRDSGENRWFLNDGQLNFDLTSDLIDRVEINDGGGLYFGDWDGDGITDFAWYDPQGGNNRWYVNDNNRPDQLVEITNSLGSVAAITYGVLTDPDLYSKDSGATYPVQDQQVPLSVVAQVSTDDGVGGQAVTSYAYAGAKVEVAGRGWLGYRLMHSTNVLTGITTTTEYRQDFPFIGQAAGSETYLADGTTLRSLANTWNTLSLNGGSTVFPYAASAASESYEINDGPGNLPITSATTNKTFDDFGNVKTVALTTTGAGQTFINTTTSQYDNDIANWFLGRVRRSDVVQQLPDGTTSTRASAFAYDLATGLLTQEVVEPDLPAFRLTTDYTRDVFGNILTTTVSGADITTRGTTTSYTSDGRFPEITSNALGHSESSVFDPELGTVVSLTGPNGITTTWDYDGFGRRVREDRADGTATVWEFRLKPPGTTWHEYYVFEKPILAATGATIGPINLTYFDLLNRVTLNRTDGFDGTFVYVNTNFNARGEVSAVSRPYFGTAPAGERQWTTTAYDVIGRPIWVVAPDGGVTSPVYDGLATTITNALGQIETRTNNAIGQLAQVTDNAGTTVSYSYDHHGNLIETNAGGVVTTMDYDIRGRKTTMDDPDMGVWSYAYNVLGELVSQTDAKNQSVTMAYDKLGRMTSRTEPEGTTTWSYDSPIKTAAIGKPDTITRSQDDYLENFVYDALGRASQTTVIHEGAVYDSASSYDSAGRLATLTYPSGFMVEQGYNAFGYLEEVRELGGAGTVYWRAVDVDAEGRTVEEQLGNGLTTLRDFDPADGLVRGVQVFQGLTTRMSQTFDFDKLGNLTSRGDLHKNRSESFTYDNLNRLTGSTLIDTVTLTQLGQTTYAYDALGNLTSKSDVGAYLYGTGIDAGPHAVTSAGGKSYAYDLNGAMTSTAITASGTTTRSVSWSSFNKPVHVTAHDTLGTTDLVYGADRTRIKQTLVKGSAITAITYVGGLFEKHATASNADQLKHYIRAGGTVAIYTKVDDGNAATDKTRYLHKDHLGSIVMVTREDGSVSLRRSHEAFGLARQGNWEASNDPHTLWETPRGFTGHEHLTSVGLIHMNGRVYDPEIGRFLSADPFVAAPETTQGFNRYSYVNNNPLSFTDPSGFILSTLKLLTVGFTLAHESPSAMYEHHLEAARNKYVQIGGYVAISIWGGPWAPLLAAAWSATITYAQGGDLEAIGTAALISGATAFAGQAVGAVFNGASGAIAAGHSSQVALQVGKAVAHGVVAGVRADAMGGKFGPAFLSAAATSLSGSATKYLDAWETTPWSKINSVNPHEITVGEMKAAISQTNWAGIVVKAGVEAGLGAAVAKARGHSVKNGALTYGLSGLAAGLYAVFVPESPRLFGPRAAGGQKCVGRDDCVIMYLNKNNFGNWLGGQSDFVPEGEHPFSRFASGYVVGGEAISRHHDVWAVWGGGCEPSNVCATTMLPSAAITYGSLFRQVRHLDHRNP